MTTRPATPRARTPQLAGRSGPPPSRERAASAGRSMARGARTAARVAGQGGRRALSVWRRSLQVRVVATTMLLGLVVVAVLGALLGQEISERLLESRRQQVQAQAEQGLDQFRLALEGSEATTPELLDQFVADQLLRLLGDGLEADRGVLLLRSPENAQPRYINDRNAGELLPSSIPTSLRAEVQRTGDQHAQSIALQGEDGVVPGLAVGQRVDLGPLAGAYELYFVFSLEREQETLERVQRVLGIGSVALVLLVGAVAWVVTRQVVAPVRQAAGVAARLSSGRLDERMPQRGEDDLARLAGSFNEMASSLQQQILRMEELSRVQRRFVSDVSHELRTPLTTIRMAGEVIHEARHDFDPAVSRSAELLATQLDRFESLLGDLLEISRFDAGAAALDAEPADVGEVVDHVVELIRPLAESRGSRLRTHLTPTPCMAELDTRRVERILRNLVVNALEHGEGRPIDITVGADADAIAVVVRDYGVGMRPEDSAHVFDRFWRADPARARTTGGSGLGLAISLEDAHLHGGDLEAWGLPGRGAAFRLTLPRRAGAAVSTSPLPLQATGRTAVPRDA
ncbi:MAG TPA: MtrAB system histidine kinase MtrB [Actinomycetales bacterium]|nr:MtrAB system histidine kinase MtrB [Actinomycetales bacterium]